MARYLSQLGYKKISELQDKYKFQNQFEIDNNDSAIEFLEGIYHAYHNGLNVDPHDIELVENILDVLTQ